MKPDDLVARIIESLRVADAKTVGEILVTKHPFKNSQSSRTRAQACLKLLAETGKIIRREGWYASKGYRGSYKEHDRLLTKALAEVLKLPFESVIFREVSFEPALRSDAAILLKRENSGLCFILEVVHNETAEYLEMKRNTWKNWEGANEALSKLFGYRIPRFSIVVSRDEPDDQFNQLLEEVRK